MMGRGSGGAEGQATFYFSLGRGVGRLCWRMCQRMARGFLAAWGDTRTQVRGRVGWGAAREEGGAQPWFWTPDAGSALLPPPSAHQGPGRGGGTGLPRWRVSNRRVTLGQTGRAGGLKAGPTVGQRGRESAVSTALEPPAWGRTRGLPYPSAHQATRWKLAGSCSVTPSTEVTPNFEPTLSTSSYCCLSALDGRSRAEVSSTSRVLMAYAPPRWGCTQGYMVLACRRLSAQGGACCHHPFQRGGPGAQRSEPAWCDPSGKLDSCAGGPRAYVHREAVRERRPCPRGDTWSFILERLSE